MELYNYKSESDEWDYKKELQTNSKDEKYNIIKDFLAFANFGGGYILIGVDEKNNYSLVDVEKKIDPASLGDLIEFNLGFNVKFDINYFSIASNGKTHSVGLIYVYPSFKILTCSRILQGSKNKIIVGVNDILTRRNTKSTKANSDDIEKINSRLRSNQKNKDIDYDKLPIFNDIHQEVDNLWDALNNKYILNSERISIILRGILWYSKHSKIDFVNLAGIEANRFESLLKGNVLPQLDELIRISNIVDLDIKFFFQPNIRGTEPFWKSDLVRYSIIKLISPISDLSLIKDVDKFLGSVIYDTAKNIYSLHSMLFDKDNKTNWKLMLDKKVVQAYDNLSNPHKENLLGELSHQHYKLLEQISERESSSGFTKQEEIVLLWHVCSSEYLARIFTESIKRIKIIDKENYKIVFHFWNELITGKIRGRTYDDKNIKMIFSKVKLEI